VIEHPAVQHEESDVNVRAVFTFVAALTVTALVVAGLVYLLFQYFNGREAIRLPVEYPLAAGQRNRLPPEPRLQTNPRQDLRELRAQEEDVLTSYRWVDRNAGVVRIPIEQAMRLTLQRGLPARGQSARDQTKARRK
jgi:hypothetical protein